MKLKTTQRAICVIMVTTIVTILTMLYGTATVFADVTAKMPSGDGSAESPYQISSAEELLWFADTVNNDSTQLGINAVLTQDIDLSDIDNWVSIGHSQAKYEGVFDGQGHAVRNMKITDVGNKLGLFGRINGGTIKNLTVSGTITCTTHTELAWTSDDCDTYNDVGGVVGKATSNSLISNVVSEVNISDVPEAYAQHIGGIVGDCCNSTIENCINKGTITIQSLKCVGGIAGYAGKYNNQTTSVKIKGCTNEGAVTTTRSETRTGGILGFINSGNIGLELSNCINTGKVSALEDQYCGALIGYRKSGSSSTSVKNDFWTSESCENAIGKDDNTQKLTYIGYTTYNVVGGSIRLDYTTSTYEVTAMDKDITSADIPNNIGNTSVTKITSGFSDMPSLVSVAIPKNATIEASAFDGCTNLANVYIYKGSAGDTFFTDYEVDKHYVIEQADGLYIDTTSTEDYDFSVVVDTTKFGGSRSVTDAQYLKSISLIADGTNTYPLEGFAYSSDKRYAYFRCKLTEDSSSDLTTIRAQILAGESEDNADTSYVSYFVKM